LDASLITRVFASPFIIPQTAFQVLLDLAILSNFYLVAQFLAVWPLPPQNTHLQFSIWDLTIVSKIDLAVVNSTAPLSTCCGTTLSVVFFVGLFLFKVIFSVSLWTLDLKRFVPG
jgi:hypothetical protein